MANIDFGVPASGKKAVDANIPLIPFIDLLLCCVMFLLVTAVWNQLASHNVVQRVPGQHAVDQPPATLRLVLHVEHAGYVVASTAGERFVIPKLGDAYDVASLRERLAAYRLADPNGQDLVLSSEDGVIFEHIVQAMDAARGVGFLGLSLVES